MTNWNLIDIVSAYDYNIYNERVWGPKDATLCLYTGTMEIDLRVQHKAIYKQECRQLCTTL